MSNIPSSQAYIQAEAAEFRRPVSENLVTTIGGGINYLNDLGAAHSATLSTHTTQISTLFSDTARTGPNSLQTQITNEIGARTTADGVLQTQLNNKVFLPYYNIIPTIFLGIPDNIQSSGTIDVGTAIGTIPIGGARYAFITVSMWFYSCNSLSIGTPSGQTMFGTGTVAFPTTITDNGGIPRNVPPYSVSCTFMLDSSSVGTSSLVFSGTFTNGRIHIGGSFHSLLTQQVVVG